MRRTLEPDVEKPPARVWRDWLLAATVAATAVVEAVVRDGTVWRLITVALGLTLALTMLWRRRNPLAMVVLGFGAFLVVDLVSYLAAGEPYYAYTGGFVVFLVYALFRWRTGRQAAIGLTIVLLEWLMSVTTDFPGVVDAAGGLVVLAFPAALGVVIRYRRIVRTQQFERVRFQEREQLARELHDTVAHHVSAIAIQAQAGQFLAGTRDLDGAAKALDVIEAEASRTLADIDGLATTKGLRIAIEHRGDLADLRPSVEAALYRVAQESITNAKRHARHATRVQVLLTGDTEGR